MRKRRHKIDEAEINIAPMLDIIFILLIFFIVTTSFVKESGIDMSRPSNAPPKTEKISEVIFVKIDASDQIFIKDRLTYIRAVRANIESALATSAESPVVVAAARESDAGVLVRVVDQARVAGAVRVSLVALVE